MDINLRNLEKQSNQANLLIVDDEINVTRSLARSMRDQFTIFTATSAPEALEIIDNNEIHVVLTDQRMPGMTGVELLKEIRVRNPQINGLILSGYSDSAALVDAINLGSVRGFIPKPWDITTLKEKVIETVTVYQHLMNQNEKNDTLQTDLQINNLKELKKFSSFINTLKGITDISPELLQLVNNPYSNDLSDHDYLNQLVDGFALIEKGGTFTFCNPAFRRFMSSKNIFQKETWQIEALKDFPELYNAIIRVLDGEPGHIESKLNSPDGSNMFLDISITPFMDAENQPNAVIVIHDQTEKEKSISFLRSLNNITNILNRNAGFDEALQLALNACTNTFLVDAAAAFFLRDGDQFLKYACGVGFKEPAENYLTGNQVSLSTIQQELENQKINSISINEINSGSFPIFPDLMNYQHFSSRAFSLIKDNDVDIGLIALFKTNGIFLDDDLLLLSAISNEIGLVRTNALLEDKLRQQAQVDSVTGLANRHYFFEIADRYYDRAGFNRTPLGVFMLDADDFKQINDNFSHLVGDQALREIARILNYCIRPGDLICRYGGDEFAIIVPNCNLELAELISERIRQHFREYRMPIGQDLIQLSVSIGSAISNFDENETIEGLLNQSDLQMYRRKNAKKNHQS